MQRPRDQVGKAPKRTAKFELPDSTSKSRLCCEQSSAEAEGQTSKTLYQGLKGVYGSKWQLISFISWVVKETFKGKTSCSECSCSPTDSAHPPLTHPFNDSSGRPTLCGSSLLNGLYCLCSKTVPAVSPNLKAIAVIQ